MMSRYCKIWLPAALVMLLGILLCSLGSSAHPYRVHHKSIIPSFAAAKYLVEKESSASSHFIHSGHDHHSDSYRSSFERKKKTRFLVRHQQQHQPVRKSATRFYNFFLPPAADPDHAPAPDDNWHTRPRYYIFLFRLSPF